MRRLVFLTAITLDVLELRSSATIDTAVLLPALSLILSALKSVCALVCAACRGKGHEFCIVFTA